jgi:carbon-monoxide dehydrogenase medium subunit
MTVLGSGQLLSAVVLPPLSAHTGSAFLKVGRVKLDMAKIACSAFVKRAGGSSEIVRVALGGAAPTPVRAKSVEQALTGSSFRMEEVARAAEKAADEISPISDVRSTMDYRRGVAPVLVRDALLSAWKRAGGEVTS